MDNNSRNEPRKAVSPYLLRPLRDHQTAQLECLVRKSWAEGWARGEDAQTITKDVSEAALSAFPDMSPAVVSVTIRQLLRSS